MPGSIPPDRPPVIPPSFSSGNDPYSQLRDKLAQTEKDIQALGAAVQAYINYQGPNPPTQPIFDAGNQLCTNDVSDLNNLLSSLPPDPNPPHISDLKYSLATFIDKISQKNLTPIVNDAIKSQNTDGVYNLLASVTDVLEWIPPGQ